MSISYTLVDAVSKLGKKSIYIISFRKMHYLGRKIQRKHDTNITYVLPLLGGMFT